MGWEVGFDENWKRDIGYGVPSICDHPGCKEEIDRGLGRVCGGEAYGGDKGCGLFFCGEHLNAEGLCERCAAGKEAFEPTPDTIEWITHKLNHESWGEWRKENPRLVADLICIIYARHHAALMSFLQCGWPLNKLIKVRAAMDGGEMKEHVGHVRGWGVAPSPHVTIVVRGAGRSTAVMVADIVTDPEV